MQGSFDDHSRPHQVQVCELTTVMVKEPEAEESLTTTAAMEGPQC